MSRKLPLVGGHRMGSNGGALHGVSKRHPAAAVTATDVVTTVHVASQPAIAVIGTHATARAEVFVDHLVVALQRSGRSHRVERSTEPVADTRLIVIVGSHVPRALRDPGVHALWERADLLLADPSAIVAEALAAAL